MDYEEAKDKILGFLDRKTELDNKDQYFLLKQITNDKFDEIQDELSGDEPIVEEEDDEFADDETAYQDQDAEEDDDEEVEELEVEPVKPPKIPKPRPSVKNNKPPLIKKPVVAIEDLDDDI